MYYLYWTFPKIPDFNDKNICYYSKRARTCHLLYKRLGATTAPATVADPGFARGGSANSRGAPTYNFAKFSQKLYEIERIWRKYHSANALFLNRIIVEICECIDQLFSPKKVFAGTEQYQRVIRTSWIQRCACILL